eukprot:CAMPEP_0117451718 /NCGR_PEP_ID=MMETSP0759-20121206/9164_1 /TAXON_ID=63605 /ORGANISM="Percolomonas cosmopolitus, Strain WS" /LENGTH=599 /DNA_ID=CAMNT_0005244351 /DNA_START=361 /DNA_END=2160 /DNA_ORIENTATION=-
MSHQTGIGSVVCDMVHDDGSVFTWHTDKSLRKIDLRTFRCSRVTNLQKRRDHVSSRAFRNMIYEGDAKNNLALCCCLKTSIFMLDARASSPLEMKFRGSTNSGEDADIGGIAWTFQDHAFVTGHHNGYVRLFDLRKVSTNEDNNIADFVHSQRHLTPDSSENIEISAFTMDSNRRRLFVNTRCDGIFCMDVVEMDQEHPLRNLTGAGNKRFAHRRPQLVSFMHELGACSSAQPEYLLAPDDSGVRAWDLCSSECVFSVSPKIEGDHSITHAILTPDTKLVVSSASSIHVHTVGLEKDALSEMDTRDESDEGNVPMLNIAFEVLSQSQVEDPDWMVDDRPRDARCTYDEGYTTQQVYTCLQCSSVDNPSGMCRNCAEICHESHNVIPIGMKSNFRCDCGNSRFGLNHPCQIQPQKESINENNIYNHNYQNRWCFCDGPERQIMLQCFACEDWFHPTCLGLTDTEANDDKIEDCTLLCRDCERSMLPDQDLQTLLPFVPFPDTIPITDRQTMGYALQNGKLILIDRSFEVKQRIYGIEQRHMLDVHSRLQDDEIDMSQAVLEERVHMLQRESSVDAEEIGETDDEDDEDEEEEEDDDGFFV